ncbi:putative transcription factor C2H2 family [Lupinus albus]|uniref:Putative transcription factor C2H2 family n=1 Tax=Lupinus albus TaxID=3870 RepID=A0A6A4NEV3_LUPAL|nr:putative transcription factor C2H2 family [Lupinus albus]
MPMNVAPFSPHMSPPSSSIDATSSPKPAFSFKTDPFDASTRSFFLFVFFILFIRFCFIYFFGDCNHDHNPNRPTHDGDDNNTSTGLPINIINSYNTFKYNKKRMANINKEHETTCSICISDYNESEILRMMPKCCHCFHRYCIDEWLKVKGSCPICRYSPTELAV